LTTDLNIPYKLDRAVVGQFNEQGFIKLKDVMPEEVIAAYEPEITKKVIELNTMHLPMSERSTYQRAFLQVSNLWKHSERVRELVFSARLARLAAELLQVDGVRLYHDQALYKEAGGGITPWHADQYYWPLSSDRTCTAWIPLQETPMEMGPLAFSAGSHHLQLGRDLPISDQSEAEFQQALDARHLPLATGAYDLGEVSFHLGRTFHRAAPNGTGIPRRVMTIIYMDADITVREPENDNQRTDLARWMPGARVGAVPDSPLNPVLYRHGS
jgi:ectoine hydroxylase-related dioxygenase (phytanoyl-CoA dioxygenase family)